VGLVVHLQKVREAIVVQHSYAEGSSREIQLELIRVRAEASAARLEARAAELELMLLAHQTDHAEAIAPSQPPDDSLPDFGCDSDAALSLMEAIRRLIQASPGWDSDAQSHAPDPDAASLPRPTEARPNQPGDWGDRLLTLQRRSVNEPGNPSATIRPEQPTAENRPFEPQGDRTIAELPDKRSSGLVDRVAASTDERPCGASEPVMKIDLASQASTDALARRPKTPNARRGVSASKIAPDAPDGLKNESTTAFSGERLAAGLAIDADREPVPELKRRPAAWITSTLAHVAVLLLLGLMTLANPKPRDQIALSASASEASDEAIESITIEALENMPETSEAMPTETAVDVSPLGELPMTEVSLDLPPAQSMPKASDFMRDVSPSAAQLSKAAVKADQPSNVQFAGVDGGGNHFVYLVDSSNSMRNFNEARTELLRSIDSLRPDQRFYVVFYDQASEFMRLANPASDEPASVLATAEHKKALRRWAMAVQQERGKSPTEVLPFAFKLRPDVIFLLSDGEFSVQTEQVIRANNHQDNLFGDAGPISIIHTIRYPGFSTAEGREAEVQMRRIAAENGGQYRNVDVP